MNSKKTAQDNRPNEERHRNAGFNYPGTRTHSSVDQTSANQYKGEQASVDPTSGGQSSVDPSSSDHSFYDLRPDWRIFFVPFVVGVLLIPLVGIGILIIRHYRKKWKNIRYRITNSAVTLIDDRNMNTIPLSTVEACDTIYSGLSARFGLGTIRIRHENGISELSGIPNPDPIATLIEHAAASERDRMKIREEVEKTTPEHPSGTLDKKNELVGLWQQGLLSEEDYHREIAKFE